MAHGSRKGCAACGQGFHDVKPGLTGVSCKTRSKHSMRNPIVLELFTLWAPELRSSMLSTQPASTLPSHSGACIPSIASNFYIHLPLKRKCLALLLCESGGRGVSSKPVRLQCCWPQLPSVTGRMLRLHQALLRGGTSRRLPAQLANHHATPSPRSPSLGQVSLQRCVACGTLAGRR